MSWYKQCTQCLVVSCRTWVVLLISTRVSGYSQAILLWMDKLSKGQTDKRLGWYHCISPSTFLSDISINRQTYRQMPVFYLKFSEHPSFWQVAHEIYPSEWEGNLSKFLLTNMHCRCMFLRAVTTDSTDVIIFNSVCSCLSPILISDKWSCWKISRSLKRLDAEMLLSHFKDLGVLAEVLQRWLSTFRAIGKLYPALVIVTYYISYCVIMVWSVSCTSHCHILYLILCYNGLICILH